MWNDTDIPIAHFITFRCYGTWLHGDDRGSIDRFNNKYGEPYIAGNANWRNYNKTILKSEPHILDAEQRQVVESAVREVCKYRKWNLHAINVRTNHVHTVVSTGEHSSKSALNAFKTYATRHLRAEGLWEHSHSPWSDKGSRRRIWNERGLEIAKDYVIRGQGGPLPDLD